MITFQDKLLKLILYCLVTLVIIETDRVTITTRSPLFTKCSASATIFRVCIFSTYYVSFVFFLLYFFFCISSSIFSSSLPHLIKIFSALFLYNFMQLFNSLAPQPTQSCVLAYARHLRV